MRRGYAAGCSEDVSDGVEEGEKPDVEGFVYLASDGGDRARRRGYTVFILPFF